MGSSALWHWLIVLVIVVLIFGTKKLRNIGADVGGAVRASRTACARRRQGCRRGRRAAGDGQDDRGRSQGKDRAEGLSAGTVPSKGALRRLFILRPTMFDIGFSELLVHRPGRAIVIGPRSCRAWRARSAISRAGCSATSPT